MTLKVPTAWPKKLATLAFRFDSQALSYPFPARVIPLRTTGRVPKVERNPSVRGDQGGWLREWLYSPLPWLDAPETPMHVPAIDSAPSKGKFPSKTGISCFQMETPIPRRDARISDTSALYAKPTARIHSRAHDALLTR